ncbi:uncharacterized protein Tco_1506305 [Tanacetum coccineum]
MHRNLFPSPQALKEFHLATTAQLIRIQSAIQKGTLEAKELFKKMELAIEARNDASQARLIVKDNLDGLSQHMTQCKTSASGEGLAECKASASNLERIRVKGIVKEVEDYLKTYSSVGMDISWYKKEPDEIDDDVTKNGPPAKLLWYFPIIPRLKRLFENKKEAKLLRWHFDRRKDDGKLRHVAESPQWRKINNKFPKFAKEIRNIRFGLSSDVINPFGNMNSRYSTWPVLLCMYNHPPWLCMKRKYIMMSLLISGLKQPGNDLDVYLSPLINDMKTLWKPGVEMYDAYMKEKFRLHAMIFCTINDFPAYGNLSRYNTKGKQACPICEDETSSRWLDNCKKTVFMGHQRSLPSNHPYRGMSSEFDGRMEYGRVKTRFSGDIALSRVSNLNIVFGKGKGRQIEQGTWKKKSIFWELEYWKDLEVRHSIDVMHIEKNLESQGTLHPQSGYPPTSWPQMVEQSVSSHPVTSEPVKPKQTQEERVKERLDKLKHKPKPFQDSVKRFTKCKKKTFSIVAPHEMYFKDWEEWIEYEAILDLHINAKVDISFIHWWAIQLHSVVKGLSENICVFLYSHVIQSSECLRNGKQVMDHIIDTKRLNPGKELYLAPYLQGGDGGHWLLFVVCPNLRRGYIVDSSKKENMRQVIISQRWLRGPSRSSLTGRWLSVTNKRVYGNADTI